MSVEELRRLIRQLARVCEEHAYSWMLAHSPTISDLERDIAEMMSVYTQSAALLAADWYNQQDRDSSFFANGDEDLPQEKVDNLAKWIFAGPQRPENRAVQVASRVVFDAARRTVHVNALAEGVGLARHEVAGCCNDCVARATLTRRGRDSGTADLDFWSHPGCEFLWVPIRKGVYEPPGHTSQWRERVSAARQAGFTSPESIAKWLDGHL